MLDAARSVCRAVPSSRDPVRVEPQTAPDGSLSDDERAALKAMRSQVDAEWSTSVWMEAARVEATAHMDDFTLMRFVKSRPGSSRAAVDMFREAMTYRSTERINDLFRELHPLAPQPWSPRQRVRAAHYFGGFGGFDREGAPYFVLRVGQADVGGMSRAPAVLELMMQADAVNMETIFRSVRLCSAATGRFVRVRIIVDLQGFGMSSLRHAGIIKRVMQVGPNVFPEGASKVFLVNAPRIFAAAWTVIAPWLPQRSRDKCSVFSVNATPAALAEVIESDQLPGFLGGTMAEADTLVARAERIPEDAAVALLTAEPVPIE